MPAPPSVTVLIAAYNAEGFLRRAVYSALSQTVSPLEIVIVDDASMDGTRELIKRLAREDERIKLLALQRNGGPSVARNAGFDEAKGEWVAILDADDAYLPERLEHMLAAATANDADIVVDNFRYYQVTAGMSGASGLAESDAVEMIDLTRFVSQARPYTGEADWGLLKPLFRKVFFDEKRLRYPLDSRHGEDFLILVEAFLAGARCALLRKAGYVYTDRSSGLSRTRSDYALMWRHSEALMRDPRVTGNNALVERFGQRVAALKRLAAERDFAGYKQAHDYVSILKRLISDPPFRTMFKVKLLEKWHKAVDHGT